MDESHCFKAHISEERLSQTLLLVQGVRAIRTQAGHSGLYRGGSPSEACSGSSGTQSSTPHQPKVRTFWVPVDLWMGVMFLLICDLESSQWPPLGKKKYSLKKSAGKNFWDPLRLSVS